MSKSALYATTISLALLGCGRGDPPSSDEPAARPPEAAAPAPPADGDPVARWAARLPDSLRHRGNACPFECCVYRDWTPTGDVALRPRPSHAETVATVIPPDQTFTADSGFVQVTGIS